MGGLIDKIASALLLSSEEALRLVRSAPYRYKEYEIPKRKGGTRRIAQPTPSVKIVQQFVCDRVLSRFPVHRCATAYREGRSILDNALVHRRSRYLLKMDFENFFNSITSKDLDRFLRNKAPQFSPDERDLLARILLWRPRRGGDLIMAIGAPSSPMLSNVLMYEFDRHVLEYCREKNVRYTRYADDLTFSTNVPNVLAGIERWIPLCVRETECPKLKVNKSKTVHVSKRGQRRVTGLTITNEASVSIGRDSKRKISAAVHHFKTGTLPPDNTGKLRGWLSYVKSVEPAFLSVLVRKYGVPTMNRLGIVIGSDSDAES